jgi:hypothetical protein
VAGIPSDHAELIETLIALRDAVPPSATALVPIPKHPGDLDWLHGDFSRLLADLKLPNFKGQYSHNWEQFFAGSISRARKERTALCLSVLFDANVDPQHRNQDVQSAAWCILFMLPDGAGTGSSPRQADDGVPVARPDELEAWNRSREAPVRRILGSLTTSGRDDAWNPQSVLRKLGYCVGAKGKPASQRRQILQDALMLHSGMVPAPQRERWGAPGTRGRLRVIVRLLRLFHDLRKHARHADFSTALAEWDADIRWLEQRYGLAE